MTPQEEIIKAEFAQAITNAAILSEADNGFSWCKPSLDCLLEHTSLSDLGILQRELSESTVLLRRYRQILAMKGYYGPLPSVHYVFSLKEM